MSFVPKAVILRVANRNKTSKQTTFISYTEPYCCIRKIISWIIFFPLNAMKALSHACFRHKAKVTGCVVVEFSNFHEIYGEEKTEWILVGVYNRFDGIFSTLYIRVRKRCLQLPRPEVTVDDMSRVRANKHSLLLYRLILRCLDVLFTYFDIVNEFLKHT